MQLGIIIDYITYNLSEKRGRRLHIPWCIKYQYYIKNGEWELFGCI